MLIEGQLATLLGILAVVVHALGIVNAAHAVMNVRSSRGAIAWSISLVTFPWLAVPLYWILGRTTFQGYAELLRAAYVEHQVFIRQVYGKLLAHQAVPPPELAALYKLAETLSPIGFTAGNATKLLIDGEQTFAAMLEAIAAAQHYILLQTYIIHDDEVGKQFQQALIAKAEQGVQIYLLYDEIGSNHLPRSYLSTLRQHQINVSAFNTRRGKGNRFQINFRNHRKILVIDGDIGFVGGLNVGDEYLGKDPKLSPWRDTHMRIEGPAVKLLQAAFLSDWYWATRAFPTVTWELKPEVGDEMAYILPTGPTDSYSACLLFFTHLINQAQTRLWIASPYFVPDGSILTALKLAAMRGVDVRIILPNHPDHLFVYWCSFSYYTEMEPMGVKLYRYKPGFMHQKVVLIDETIAGVGTVNLDNRSFFLNFEVMSFVTSPRFVEQVERMLLDDLTVSSRVKLSEYTKRSIGFKLMVQVSRLLAPIL